MMKKLRKNAFCPLTITYSLVLSGMFWRNPGRDKAGAVNDLFTETAVTKLLYELTIIPKL